MRTAAATLLCVSLLLGGCASRTVIRSDPPGARVYVDGQPVGRTPYEHSDSKVAFMSTLIELRKDGYEPFITTIKKDEELNTAACLFGPCCFVPYLWIFGYKSERLYALQPERVPSAEDRGEAWPGEGPGEGPGGHPAPGDEHLPQPWDPPL